MRHLFALAVLAALAQVGGLVAAETATVLEVPSADRVVVKFGTIPVVLPLAHIEVPTALADAARIRLAGLVKGQSVRIDHVPGWGTDAGGTGKVHLKTAKDDAAQVLISEGLARFVPGTEADPTNDKLLAMVQSQAEKAKKGLWGAETTVAAAKPAPTRPEPAAATKPEPASQGAFASELNSTYYYPAGHRALANVNPQRLIRYRDESAAKKAGKSPAPLETVESMAAGTEATADRLFTEGESIYTQAIAAGNSSKRDDLYGEAFVKLSDAMNIYGALVEKDETNEALAEKLRRCMQLRYGAIKQRRAH